MLDILYDNQREENSPELKFLIFTEFVPTQGMLREFLEEHGFSVVCLNGSMDLDQRRRVQQSFAEKTRILVSTDAGGEGLNLQFAHVVINYDLPWNPMRIEQRIGRVDRIGQKHPVKAFNLVFEDSVELRVREVLENKLLTILDEFGVDKTGVIAPVPGIMRLFWAFSPSTPPESPSQEDSSLANMLDTLEARCRSDGPPAGPRSIDPLPGSRSFLTVSAVA